MGSVVRAFAEVRRCSAKIEDCRRVISEIEYDIALPTSTDGRHGVGVATDPVFAALSLRDRILENARSEMDAALSVVGDALVLIDDMRRIFCRKADVLELYYVDRKTWADVADEMGVAERTARAWRDELCDFMESVPQLRLRAEQLGGFME